MEEQDLLPDSFQADFSLSVLAKRTIFTRHNGKHQNREEKRHRHPLETVFVYEMLVLLGMGPAFRVFLRMKHITIMTTTRLPSPWMQAANYKVWLL
jgi:hypothetical protein